MKWFANRSIKVKLALVIMMGFAAFALLNSFTWYTLSRTRKSSELLERSHNAVEASVETLNSLTNMETSYRGFLISGDAAFLDAFNQRKTVCQQQIAMVKQLTEGDKEQAKLIAELEEWAEAWQSNVTRKGI